MSTVNEGKCNTKEKKMRKLHENLELEELWATLKDP